MHAPPNIFLLHQVCRVVSSPVHTCSDTQFSFSNTQVREFLGGIVIRILGFHFLGLGSILVRETEILQGGRCGQTNRPTNQTHKRTLTRSLAIKLGVRWNVIMEKEKE